MSLVENINWKVFVETVEAFLFMPVHSRPTVTTEYWVRQRLKDRGFHALAKTTKGRGLWSMTLVHLVSPFVGVTEICKFYISIN